MNKSISSDFKCQNCSHYNSSNPLGTKQRNHCYQCLSSLHLDKVVPGDRLSLCKGLMPAIGLYAKNNLNKYDHKNSLGEIKILHQCHLCQHLSANRIAGDDNENSILDLLKPTPKQIEIYQILAIDSYDVVLRQLRGDRHES